MRDLPMVLPGRVSSHRLRDGYFRTFPETLLRAGYKGPSGETDRGTEFLLQRLSGVGPGCEAMRAANNP